MSKYTTLALRELEAGIVLVTLNRPEVFNSINTEMMCELKDFYKNLNNSSYRVVIITGSGNKAFCAGADLKVRSKMSFSELKEQHHHLEELNFIALDNLVPVIAAVNGYAFGGGAEIALLADFIYASQNATFALPETKVGLIPGFGGTQRMPRRIGVGRAKEMILSGKPISAELAFSYGLVNKVCVHENLISECLEVARLISSNAPISIAQAKRAIDKGYDLDLKVALSIEIDCYNTALDTEDRVEGILAFSEKRKPIFKGK